MTQYSKFNIVYRLQKWLDSVPGQTFMNYAYSWGASIVILGALFKLTHLPGANVMLFLGMGTEVFVFFIAGFDRPFDKTEDGKEIPTHYVEEAGELHLAAGAATGVAGGGVVGGTAGGGVVGGGSVVVGGASGGGTVIIGGGSPNNVATDAELQDNSASVAGQNSLGSGVVGGVIGGIVAPEVSELPEIDAESMEQATTNYVEKLNQLAETLERVSEQNERLTRDSEEMENLNRTLTGICKVYEMQLKGASQQIGTIDEINEQTRKMAEQIAELNRIYARMIEAMTSNMPKVAGNDK